MNTAVIIVYALAILGAVPSVSAQARSDSKADAEARTTHVEQRFKEADKDGDGKLSRAEAEATMPRIAKNFDKIDKNRKGYVTVEQVKDFAAGGR